MPKQPPLGVSATVRHTVTDQDTASALGSGDVPVLATPRLVAYAEQATVQALAEAGAVGSDTTSVGTRVAVDHLLATPVGGSVEVRAELVYVDGRLTRFAVTAHDDHARLVAQGEVTRVLVGRERFLARLPRTPGPAAASGTDRRE